MENFVCKFEIEGLPEVIKSGQNLTVTAKITEASAPVQTIVVSVPEGNVYSRMKKVSDTEFSLSLTVPYGGEGMSVQAVVYALSEDNRRSERKYVNIKIGY